MRSSLGLGLALLVLASLGCNRHPSVSRRRASLHTATATPARDSGTCPPAVVRRYDPDPRTRERDEILILLAYAIASDDWRGGDDRTRGLDIAAVLADSEGRPLCWARNSAMVLGDATQHAEVRVLTSYLRSAAAWNAHGLRLYSVLEPCAMCAGMTLMTGVDTVLYGEHATGAGRVYERLAFDGHEHGGECPYPYTTVAAPAPTRFVALLDAEHAFAHSAAGWVEGEGRRARLEEAARALDTFTVQDPANEPVLAAVRAFRARVPRSVPEAPYRIGCPSFDSDSP